MKRFALVATLLALSALTVAPAAFANDPNEAVSMDTGETATPPTTTCGPSDPATTFGFFRVSRVNCAGVLVTCKGRTLEVFYRNLLGNKLISYFQRIYWCYGGGRVRSASRTRWAEVHAPAWRFDGHIGSNITWGTANSFYRAFTQGKFSLCIIHCFQQKTPWIRQTGYSGGGYSYSYGG